MKNLNDSGSKKKQPKRGPPSKGEPTARERILATAMDLFHREGIQTTGVDTIVERSNVSKTSLYRTFSSKDDLIAAVVSEQNRLFWAWWDDAVARYPGRPRRQLQAVLQGIARLSAAPKFRGCPFINAATEFRDVNHPGRAISRANKAELKRRLAGLCADMGSKDAERCGSRLLLLIDGALAGGLVVGPGGTDADLVDAAFRLID